MQLTQDNVQNFVDGVMEYYGERTLLGDAPYMEDYGSRNLPLDRTEESVGLQFRHFETNEAEHAVKTQIDDITSFEQSKFLNGLDEETDCVKQVDANDFASNLLTKARTSLLNPVQLLVPDEPDYIRAVETAGFNPGLPINWFRPEEFDRTAFAIDGGARIFQKRQGDTAVVSDDFDVGQLPKDNSGNGLIIELKEGKRSEVQVFLRSKFSPIHKLDDEDSICALELPDPSKV